MLQFTTTILKYGQHGEKTGWTYIPLSAAQAQQLKPNHKKSFRVKGRLDACAVEGLSLVPVGGGDFILPINATLRRQIKKGAGALLQVQLTVDEKKIPPHPGLLACLADEPDALAFFNRLPPSHQRYYTRWISEAKTMETRDRRIALAVTTLARGGTFGQAVKSGQADNGMAPG